MRKIIAFAAFAVLALAPATAATAASPIGHDRFTSDAYADNWCGIDGTSVDRVVANYTADGSRASINVVTTFTATASGKSMEIRQTGARKSGAPIDNGNGTYSVVFTNAGQSPGFYLPNGVVAHDTGLVKGIVTFDSVTDEFLDFQVVKIAGPRLDACPAIIAALA
jgi:hypothetical protein